MQPNVIAPSPGADAGDLRAASAVRDKQPGYMECSKVGYTINGTRILSDIDLVLPPGRLVAVMGPSGAGKTTLLHLLGGLGRGVVDGVISLNGNKISRKMMRMESKLVPQHDRLTPCLTARQTLRYTAELALAPGADREARVDEVLNILSLNACADVVCGGPDLKGLSGGQLKRVSIGMELIQDPSVLLLDEPTSGLDSKVAEDVVEMASALAKGGRTVVCTIHQPSFQVFSKFDWLVMLDKGRVAYNGEVSGLARYLEEINRPCPEFINPADHLMQVLSEPVPGGGGAALQEEEDLEAGAKGKTKMIRDPGFNALFNGTSFGARALEDMDAQRQSRAAYIDGDQRDSAPGGYPTSFLKQVGTISRRALHITVKDKSQLTMRVVQLVFMGIVLSTIFLRMENTQARAQDRLSVLFLVVLFLGMSSIMGTAMALPDEKHVFLREMHNGYYALSAYFVGRLSVLIGFQVLYGVLFGAAIYFPLGFFNAAYNFFIFLACLALASTISGIAGFIAGTIFPTPQQATASIPMIVLPLTIFAGLFVAYDAIPVYFIWLYYISYFQYAIQIMMVNEFEDANFDPCSVEQILNPDGTCPYGPCSLDPLNPGSCPGTKVLNRLDYNPDDMGLNFGILIAFVFALLAVGGVALRRMVDKSR